MKSIYFLFPKALVACNFKVGSSSFARAAIGKDPAILSQIEKAHYPKGKGPDNTRWQGFAPKGTPDGNLPVLVPVRDPIEKFQSACAESRVSDVDAKTQALQDDWGKDPHFWPQVRFLTEGAKLYRFPLDLEALAADAGLEWPLPNIDGNHNRSKPKLTKEQELQITALYSEDVALFESITGAGQICNFINPITATDYREQRRQAYETEGVSIGAITIALLEKEEGRPEELERLQVIRANIKSQYPKS